jgi:hypothetical protein
MGRLCVIFLRGRVGAPRKQEGGKSKGSGDGKKV